MQKLHETFRDVVINIACDIYGAVAATVVLNIVFFHSAVVIIRHAVWCVCFLVVVIVVYVAVILFRLALPFPSLLILLRGLLFLLLLLLMLLCCSGYCC